MTTTITLGPLQLAGLICHAPQEDIDALDLDGPRLTVTDADLAAGIVNDASNSADEQHERDGEAMDRRMAVALAMLAGRIRRAA